MRVFLGLLAVGVTVIGIAVLHYLQVEAEQPATTEKIRGLRKLLATPEPSKVRRFRPASLSRFKDRLDEQRRSA